MTVSLPGYDYSQRVLAVERLKLEVEGAGESWPALIETCREYPTTMAETWNRIQLALTPGSVYGVADPLYQTYCDKAEFWERTKKL